MKSPLSKQVKKIEYIEKKESDREHLQAEVETLKMNLNKCKPLGMKDYNWSRA